MFGGRLGVFGEFGSVGGVRGVRRSAVGGFKGLES